MPKTLKPLSSKKAPEAAESHADIAEWMRTAMPELQPLVRRLDKLIRDTIPGLQYAVKWKKAYYGLPKHGWLIELVPYDVSVNIVFFGGKDFDPRPPLGTSGRSRYVKLTSMEEVKDPSIGKWIKQAAHVRGWK